MEYFAAIAVSLPYSRSVLALGGSKAGLARVSTRSGAAGRHRPEAWSGTPALSRIFSLCWVN
jgi:hypothetical protein